MEACSQAGWVSDLCHELGLQVTVASTTGAAWQWKHVKRKTDRDDALKLARLAAVGEIQAVSIPSKEVRQRKSLIGLRKRLVGERIRGQNRIRGLVAGQGLSMPRGAKAWTAEGIAILRDFAKPLAECQAGELYRGELSLLLERYQTTVEQISALERALDAIATKDPLTNLIVSVPGIGPRTAEIIATSLGDAKRFRNADEVSAFAGLVPRQYQSGETDRRGRITKRGSKVLRSALVECAWCSLRYNAWARGIWTRLVANGLSKKKAIVALARKLLVRCWGMLKRGEFWHEPPVLAATTPALG